MTTSDDMSNDNTPDSSADCAETSCRDAVEELYVFLDGELDEAKRSTIQTHIHECQPCLEMFDFHVELKRVVSTKCRSEVPQGLRDRVFAALQSFDDPDA